MNRLLIARSLLGCAAVAAGCGGPQAFEPTFEAPRDPGFSEVLEGLSTAPARSADDVIVGVTAEPATLFAWDLTTGRERWRKAAVVLSAPLIAGRHVVTQERTGIVARRLEDGTEAFRIEEEGQRLVGADGDGRFTAISLATGSETNPHGMVYLADGDSIAWERDLQLPVGVPATQGGYVIVPWATQRLSFLGAEHGRELARIQIRDDVVGHAFISHGVPYAGQHGLFRINERIESGSRADAVYYQPQGRPLPGQPPLLRDGYAPMPAPDNAQHRVRMIFGVGGDGEAIGLDGDNLYFLFYRLLFAFDPNSEALRWVYLHPADIVGAAVSGDGVLLVGEDGNLARVDGRSGRRIWEAAMGTAVQVATVRAAGTVAADDGARGAQAAPAQPAAAPANGDQTDRTETDGTQVVASPPADAAVPADDGDGTLIAEQLFEAANVDDARLAAGRALAVTYLQAYPDAIVTERLIDLCVAPHAPEPVRVAACDGIKARQTGAEHIRPHLDAHASFLEDTPAPPIGALALALANMQQRRDVPKLLQHLSDPGTPSRELPGLITALGVLGVRSAARPIEAFLHLYHADVGDADLLAAVGAAAEALAALRDNGALTTLRTLAADPLSDESVRTRILAVIAAIENPPAAAPAEETSVPPPAEEVPDNRPVRLTTAITDRILAPVQTELVACLPNGTASARVSMLIRPTGALETVAVTPSAAHACVEPLIRSRTFPATRAHGMEQVVHVIRR